MSDLDNVAKVYYWNSFLLYDGVLLALVRFNEPCIWTNLKADLGCCFKPGKRSVFTEESLDSFLNSAMNIEYVYLFLLGIHTYFQGETNSQSKIKIEVQDQEAKITFENIEMKDASKWDINL